MPVPRTSKGSSKSAAKSGAAKSTKKGPAKSSGPTKSGGPAKSGAPKFALESDAGTRVKLADYAGKWLVVYFYPRDNTPGCTREAQDFTEAVPELRKLGAEVLGISKDSVKSHSGFKEKIGIRFPLLSDPDLSTHKSYGAWGTKTMYGKKVEGTIRSTFLVTPAGEIARSWTGVKVDGHAGKVIAALKDLQEGDPG
jgi:peroxiredoxin Q/BCP